MRRGEILGLRWDQIRNGFIYLSETKSGKARQIPVSACLAQVLKELQQKNQLKSPHVFCNSQGRRFYEVKWSFVSACRRVGLEDCRFHDLRHIFASHLVMKGGLEGGAGAFRPRRYQDESVLQPFVPGPPEGSRGGAGQPGG
jgi:integrase